MSKDENILPFKLVPRKRRYTAEELKKHEDLAKLINEKFNEFCQKNKEMYKTMMIETHLFGCTSIVMKEKNGELILERLEDEIITRSRQGGKSSRPDNIFDLDNTENKSLWQKIKSWFR